MFSSKKSDDGILPEAPTAHSKEELIVVAEKLLTTLVAIEVEDTWTPVHFNDKEGDIILFDREIKGNPIRGLKAIGTIMATSQRVFEVLWDADLARRKKWDVGVMRYDVIETASPDVQVVQSSFDAPFPVKSREFLQVRMYKEDNGTYYVMHYSINFPGVPVGKDCVRAFAVSGYLIRPVPGHPDQTQLTLLAQVDPKGNVPGFVVNLGKGKGAEAIQNIRKFFVLGGM